jgi:hypothetical protein
MSDHGGAWRTMQAGSDRNMMRNICDFPQQNQCKSTETQSVGHDQNDIARWRCRCLRESRERKGCRQDFRSEEEKRAHAQLQGLERESRLRVAHDSHVTTVESVAFASIPTVDVLGRAEAELAG